MHLFKVLLVLSGLILVSPNANAQVVNGDFSSGTSSWSWAQTVPGGGPCSSVQQFTPSLNSDTPNKFVGYGRSAKADGNQNTIEAHGFFCRQISQELDMPIGSKLQFDIWTNAGRNASGLSSYSEATIVVILKDIASSYQRSYQIDRPYCSPLDRCSTPLGVVLDLDSAFWGKRVKFTIETTTEYRRGTSGGGYMYGATVNIDNIMFVKPVIAAVPLKTGSWYNPTRSGHGLHFSRTTDGRYQLIWYTYLSNGRPIWYISEVAPMINGVFTGKIYKTTWNYSTQTNSSVVAGDIKLETHYTNQLTFSWDLYSVNGDSVGYDGGEPMFHLLGQGSYTGNWYEPALSGYGYSIDHRNSDNYTATTVFYYINGEPVWARGEKASAPTANNITSLISIKGLGLCPECNGQTITKTTLPVGEVGLSLDVNKSWVYIQDTAGVPVWQRGLPQQPVDTYRLTYP